MFVSPKRSKIDKKILTNPKEKMIAFVQSTGHGLNLSQNKIIK